MNITIRDLMENLEEFEGALSILDEWYSWTKGESAEIDEKSIRRLRARVENGWGALLGVFEAVRLAPAIVEDEE